jgi:hypothetical protein
MRKIKEIPGFEGVYAITTSGEIFSYPKNTSKGDGYQHVGRWLKECDVQGYKVYGLMNNNKLYQYKTHRLVALTYIPNPENKPQVNHINGNKSNNHISNLEWCTAKENNVHAYNIGLKNAAKGKNHYMQLRKRGKHHNAKKVKCITTNEVFDCLKDARIKYNTSHISQACKGARKYAGTLNNIPLLWEYIC